MPQPSSSNIGEQGLLGLRLLNLAAVIYTTILKVSVFVTACHYYPRL